MHLVTEENGMKMPARVWTDPTLDVPSLNCKRLPLTAVSGSTRTRCQRVPLSTTLHLSIKHFTLLTAAANQTVYHLTMLNRDGTLLHRMYRELRVKLDNKGVIVLEARWMMLSQRRGRNILRATWGRTLTAARTRSAVKRPATLISNIDSHENLCRRCNASCSNNKELIFTQSCR